MRKRSYALLIFLLTILPFLHAVFQNSKTDIKAYAAIGQSSQSQSGGSNSWSHTVGTQSDRLLVVGTNGSATAVSYSGRPLTRGTVSGQASIWYLTNPPSGTATITVTGSGTIYAGATNFYNVDQSSPIGTTGGYSVGTAQYCFSNNGSSTLYIPSTGSSIIGPAPMSPTTTGQITVDYFYFNVTNGTGIFTPESGQSTIFTRTINSRGTAGMSYKSAGASSTSMRWGASCGGSGGFEGSHYATAMALNAAPATSTGTVIYDGTVFVDTNKNGTQDSGESGYQGASVRLTNTTNGQSATATTNAQGAYTVQLTGTGTFCAEFPTVPNGYEATTTQGPTRCLTVTGSNNTTTNTANFGIATTTPASSSGGSGDIINLNFGINNSEPWFMVVCGDVRVDSGIDNKQPTGENLINTNSNCTSPGIAFTGNGVADFGDGQASSTNQIVGGANYPETFGSSEPLATSYEPLIQKADSAQLDITNLASICTLLNCTLPNNLPSGIYYAPSNVVLNAYTFPANRDYVFLINGSMTIKGNLLTLPSDNTSVVISTANDIIIAATVGNAVSDTSVNLSGIYSAGRSFIIQGNGNCNDLRLIIEGTILVNASRNGGVLQNNRDLCGSNATVPVMQITQRLDFVLNLPEFVRYQQITSQEIAP